MLVLDFALCRVGALFRLGAGEWMTGRREGLSDCVKQRPFSLLLRRLFGRGFHVRPPLACVLN